MKAKTLGRLATFAAFVKAPKLTYVARHPVKGSRNLLMLRGAKSLLKTRGAAVAAAVTTTAVAIPLAVMALKGSAKD